MRHAGAAMLTSQCMSTKTRQLGRKVGFVDEDQFFRIEAQLTIEPSMLAQLPEAIGPKG